MSHNLVFLRYLSSSRSHGFRLPDPLISQLRTRTMSSKSTSWSAVVAASVPKSYKAQALRLVPGLEARLTIREGVLVTMTGGRRVEVTPEDLISFLVTKKKTSIAPEMLAQLLPEIDVIKPGSISPSSKKILEEARKLSQSRDDSENPSSVSPPIKGSKKKKREVKITKENEKKTEPIKVLHVKDVFSQGNFKEELKRIGTEGKDLVTPSVIGQVVSQETSVEQLSPPRESNKKVEKANSFKNNLSDLKKAPKREPSELPGAGKRLALLSHPTSGRARQPHVDQLGLGCLLWSQSPTSLRQLIGFHGILSGPPCNRCIAIQETAGGHSTL